MIVVTIWDLITIFCALAGGLTVLGLVIATRRRSKPAPRKEGTDT